ncbi:MAG: hypothetical protein HQ475_09380 [SAR202 cluster bacterium]|nr:hypothetical protein [SAR202 cluster bacterium]
MKEPKDRAYWEKRSSIITVKMADNLLDIIHSFDSDFRLNYKGYSYIGLTRHRVSNNFVDFRPTPDYLFFGPRIEETDEIHNLLKAAGFHDTVYRQDRYRVKLCPGDIESQAALLTQLIEKAFRKAGI